MVSSYRFGQVNYILYLDNIWQYVTINQSPLRLCTLYHLEYIQVPFCYLYFLYMEIICQQISTVTYLLYYQKKLLVHWY